jgi:hypothetical protein
MKEIDRETIRKVIYYEKMKKMNSEEYHYLQGDEISYIYQQLSPYSNEKWKEKNSFKASKYSKK